MSNMDALVRHWQEASDEAVVEAAEQLDDFTDEGRRVVLGELQRRGLAVPPPENESADPLSAGGDDSTAVTIRRYFSPVEAQADLAALEGAGLRSWVLDDAAGTNWGFGVGARLQVASEDEAEARAILEPDAIPESTVPTDVAERAPAPLENDEPKSAISSESPEVAAPAPEASPVEDDERPGSVDAAELTGVLLFTSVWPIAYGLTTNAESRPTSLGALIVDCLWFAGLALVVWSLMRRRPTALVPRPLPRSFFAWGREALAGFALYFGTWILVQIVGNLLSNLGVPKSEWHATPYWASAYQWPGALRLNFLFAAVYEEVVFRAYLICRLSFVLRGRVGWAVVAAAALFALGHGYPAMPTLTILTEAIVYGTVYVRTRSVPRLVLAHWAGNLAVMSIHRHSM